MWRAGSAWKRRAKRTPQYRSPRGRGGPKPSAFVDQPLQGVQCLATAAVYEAGDDERGQKAVMQVVLNRLARPGYPKTVCGVVYQGAFRTTGCRHSFSCDGS